MCKKLLGAMISFVCITAATSSYANTFTYKPPASAGIIWIIVKPDVFTNADYPYYKISLCVKWGTYSRCESPSVKSSSYNYVISLRHLDNNQYPITVTTSVGTVLNVVQGSSPVGPYDTLLNW